MTGDVKPRRAYHSPRREDAARATRTAVLDAASVLFLEDGYAATSMGAIARRAGVSVETVHAVFGTKGALLSTLVDTTVAGGPDAPAIADQPWVAGLRAEAEPDVRRRLRLLARNGSAILLRRWRLDLVVQVAGAADPAVADLAARLRRERYEGQRALVALALDGAALRGGLDPGEATDLVYALGSPETCRLLLLDRGWSEERFAEWYTDVLERLLLA
jgi:AcrR family transcriptional regulator